MISSSSIINEPSSPEISKELFVNCDEHEYGSDKLKKLSCFLIVRVWNHVSICFKLICELKNKSDELLFIKSLSMIMWFKLTLNMNKINNLDVKIRVKEIERIMW